MAVVSLASAAQHAAPEAKPEAIQAPSAAPSRSTPLPQRRRRWSLRPKPRRVDAGRHDIVAARPGTLLCVDAITVSFDGFKALDDLTLLVDKGELRCIIGPNGAGKTTLMDVITGKTRPSSGTVFMVGCLDDMTQLSEYEIAQLGIGRKFQRPTVFPGHSVLENLELALEQKRGVWHALFGKLTGEQRDRIDAALGTIGLAQYARSSAGLLSHGQKQWLEIGMLLVQNPKLLLIDEPVAGMTHQEVERTAELLSSLAGQHTLLVVEHDMDFIRSIAAKTVTVLHEGRILAEGKMEVVQNDPKVIEVYLGE
jgi:urea transport system ATP-binding protein